MQRVWPGLVTEAGRRLSTVDHGVCAQHSNQLLAEADEARLQAHALVLKLPEALCVERAMHRVNHEGGVEGANAPAIVRRMNANIVRAGLPAASEGIASVSVRCLVLACIAALSINDCMSPEASLSHQISALCAVSAFLQSTAVSACSRNHYDVCGAGV